MQATVARYYIIYCVYSTRIVRINVASNSTIRVHEAVSAARAKLQNIIGEKILIFGGLLNVLM